MDQRDYVVILGAGYKDEEDGFVDGRAHEGVKEDIQLDAKKRASEATSYAGRSTG